MNCPKCNKPVSIFSVGKSESGKGNICPHCREPVKVSVSIPLLLLWLIPATVVVVFLYPWLGAIGTMLACSAALFLSIRIKPA